MSIYLAFTLTALIETGLFYVLGYRDRKTLVLIAAVNVLSNILLNLSFRYLSYERFLVPGEILVVICEYLAYASYMKGSLKLFLITLCANLLTFFIGLIV